MEGHQYNQRSVFGEMEAGPKAAKSGENEDLKIGTWLRTGVNNLIRHSFSGRYYSRFRIRGKVRWRSLMTDSLEIARRRLAEQRRDVERERRAQSRANAGKASVRDLISVYAARVSANPAFTASTKRIYLAAIDRLRRTWPGIEALRPRDISPDDVVQWSIRLQTNGIPFRSRNSSEERIGSSPSVINQTVDALRAVLDIAVDAQEILVNPASAGSAAGDKIKKRQPRRSLDLPETRVILRIIAAVEGTGTAGREKADLCRLLLYSGARIGEARLLTWACVEWEQGALHIPGFKTAASDRRIPLFTELRSVLRSIWDRRLTAAAKSGRGAPAPSEPILRARGCQLELDLACAQLATLRVTHHTFRHIFATSCLECKVHVPTLAQWMGHNDGGMQLLSTYAHLRIRHHAQEAGKVVFADFGRAEADVSTTAGEGDSP